MASYGIMFSSTEQFMQAALDVHQDGISAVAAILANSVGNLVAISTMHVRHCWCLNRSNGAWVKYQLYMLKAELNKMVINFLSEVTNAVNTPNTRKIYHQAKNTQSFFEKVWKETRPLLINKDLADELTVRSAMAARRIKTRGCPIQKQTPGVDEKSDADEATGVEKDDQTESLPQKVEILKEENGDEILNREIPETFTDELIEEILVSEFQRKMSLAKEKFDKEVREIIIASAEDLRLATNLQFSRTGKIEKTA